MSHEVPLANIADEWNEFTDHQNAVEYSPNSIHRLGKSNTRSNVPMNSMTSQMLNDAEDEEDDDDLKCYTEHELPVLEGQVKGIEKPACESIQELVNNFDEQIINCFTDYDQPIEQLAPVQVLNQDELINECQ
jgi:hypothetical protein